MSTEKVSFIQHHSLIDCGHNTLYNYFQDISYIICLNVLLWIGVALLCSLFEYDFFIHPCVFILVSSLLLSPLVLVSLKMVTMTQKLSPGAGTKVLGLVALDGCVGLSLMLAIGVVLVQQKRARDKKELVTIETEDSENMVIAKAYSETDV